MTLRGCRQPRICPWKLINSLLGHKVLTIVAETKCFQRYIFWLLGNERIFSLRAKEEELGSLSLFSRFPG